MRLSAAILPFFVLGATSQLAACQSPSAASKTSAVSEAVEPGSSYANPILLDGVTDEGSGVRAEHVYTDKHFPGFRWSGQSLRNKDGRIYDVIELTDGGTTKTVYFDITDWFGKM